MILPLPNQVYIPATSSANTLLYDDTSLSLVDVGLEAFISMKTNNKYALLIDDQQRLGINTTDINSQLTINGSSNSVLTLKRLNDDETSFNIDSAGNLYITVSGNRTILNNILDIPGHTSTISKFSLGGTFITATAMQINTLNTTFGNASPSKALILDSNKNIIGINSFQASTITGTLQTNAQPNITSVNTLNISQHDGDIKGLKLNGALVSATAEQLNYTRISTPGVANASKALVIDSNRDINNINKLICSKITGELQSANQPNITTIGALTNLGVNGKLTVGRSGFSPVMLDVSNTNGSCIRLSKAGSNTVYSTLDIDGNGSLLLSSTNNKISIVSNNNFHIDSHNGSSRGLWLNGSLVLSSATELNYVKVIPGTASPEKALVVDIDRKIQGLALIQTSTIEGMVLTKYQPKIEEVDILNIKIHNGTDKGLSLNGTLVKASANEINTLKVVKGVAEASKALVLDINKNISGIQTVSSAFINGTILTPNQPNINLLNTLTIIAHNGSTSGLTLGSTLVSATGEQLNFNKVSPGTASPLKSLVVDSNRSISNIHSLTASQIIGTLQTGPQPNITSVNSLNITGHTGNNSTGLSLNGILITSSAIQLNYLNIAPGSGGPSKALVLNNNRSIFNINEIQANLLGGIISTEVQPNIKEVNTLDIADHDGNSTGLYLGGTLVRVTASELNYLDVLPGTSTALKAVILDASLNITGVNSIVCNQISGIISTQTQPFINTLNELNILNHNGTNTGLKLNGVLITCSADQINRNNVVPGTVSPLKTVIADAQKNITGINDLYATNIYGKIGTASQPNINIVNRLNILEHNGSTIGLSLGGVLIEATAAQINYLKTNIGDALPLKAMILDNTKSIKSINNLEAETLKGVLTTGPQPNISSVNSLNIINHNGSNGLRLNGSLVVATANQLNYTTALAGTASPSKALITNSVNSIFGINTLSSTKIITEQLEVNGVIKNLNTGALKTKVYSSTDFNGRLVDSQLLSITSFSNIIPGGLTNNFSMEIIGYIHPQYSEAYTFFVQCQDRVRLWVNNKLILCSWTYIGTPRTSNTIFLNSNTWYPIYIQYQVDSNNNSFSLEWLSSTTVRSIIQSNRLAWDNNEPNHNINHFVQNALTIYNSSTSFLNQTSFTVDNSGDLLIDSSGNDVRFGLNDSVDISSHNGTSSGLYLGGQLVTPTAFELNYLKVSPGTVSPTHALVVDGTNSITGLSSLSSTSLNCTSLTASNFTISDLVLNGPLSNFNTGGLLIKQIMGADLSGRTVDVSITETLSLVDYDPKGLNNLYSIEISGYILPQFSENYIFYMTANDRGRLWVDDKLLLNIWDSYTGVEYSSSPITLVANQWTRIYIQFQNITGSSLFEIKWSSQSTSKNLINSSFMSWDNRQIPVSPKTTILDSITLSTSSPYVGTQTGMILIDSLGSMTIQSTNETILINNQNSLNISGHNGSTRGLRLNNVLVTASALELNFLKGASSGMVNANKVIIADANRDLININLLSANTLSGVITTGSQPNITAIGTLTSTLSVSSDILTGDLGSGLNGRIRLCSENGISYIQSGTSSLLDNSNDIMIGNINANVLTSSRKFMIKSSGFTGIQTSLPTRTLSINGNANTYCLRLIHNNSTGTETNGYVDLGVDLNGNYTISPKGTVCNILSDLRIGTSTSNALFSMNGSTLKIASTSGTVQIGNTTSTNLPLEIGSSTFSISSGTYGYVNQYGSAGISADTTNQSFSLRTTGRIIVGGEVDIISDRRTKNEIKKLDIEHCRHFIDSIDAVSFKFSKSVEDKTHYGYIAQDIYKQGFCDLVSIVPDNTMEESLDSDGFLNPKNQKFTLCYDEIIPILSTTIKDLYEENRQLKETVSLLANEIKWIKSKLI